MKILSENRRAEFDYEILEKFEVGVSLIGQEVKSVKEGHMNLSGSYALLRGGEIWLVNAQIPAWQPNNAKQDYEPGRDRRLLLTKDEIKILAGRLHEKSLSLVPLKSYLNRNLIKLTLGLGRSRKKADKRDVIKKRDIEREAGRRL